MSYPARAEGLVNIIKCFDKEGYFLKNKYILCNTNDFYRYPYSLQSINLSIYLSIYLSISVYSYLSIYLWGVFMCLHPFFLGTCSFTHSKLIYMIMIRSQLVLLFFSFLLPVNSVNLQHNLLLLSCSPRQIKRN